MTDWSAGVYDDDGWPVVCVTHRRFIPCRSRDGCVMSTEPSDVDDVRRYQSGEVVCRGWSESDLEHAAHIDNEREHRDGLKMVRDESGGPTLVNEQLLGVLKRMSASHDELGHRAEQAERRVLELGAEHALELGLKNEAQETLRGWYNDSQAEVARLRGALEAIRGETKYLAKAHQIAGLALATPERKHDR